MDHTQSNIPGYFVLSSVAHACLFAIALVLSLQIAKNTPKPQIIEIEFKELKRPPPITKLEPIKKLEVAKEMSKGTQIQHQTREGGVSVSAEQSKPMKIAKIAKSYSAQKAPRTMSETEVIDDALKDLPSENIKANAEDEPAPDVIPKDNPEENAFESESASARTIEDATEEASKNAKISTKSEKAFLTDLEKSAKDSLSNTESKLDSIQSKVQKNRNSRLGVSKKTYEKSVAGIAALAAKDEEAKAAADAAKLAGSGGNGGSGGGASSSGFGRRNGNVNESNGDPYGVPNGIRKLDQLRQMPGNRKPEYTIVERRARHQGDVIYYAYISNAGIPIRFVRAHSTGFETLDESTLTALKTWRFYPGQQGWVELPFNWSLKGGVQEAPSMLRRSLTEYSIH